MSNSQDTEVLNGNSSSKHFAIVAEGIRDIEVVIALIVQEILHVRLDKLVFIDYGNHSDLLQELSVRLKEKWSNKQFCPNEIIFYQLRTKAIS